MESECTSVTSDYTEIVPRLPISLKLAYGIGHILNDICASMWFTYLLIFLHLVLGFNATWAGMILLIGQIADALATSFVGFYSDKNDDFWLCKYGRRKTWHLIGTFCVIFAFPFIFLHCIGCETSHEWAQIIYYAAFAIIFQFGWAAVQVSHLALVPELTPNEHERAELIAIRYSFTVLSNIFVYCITWAILHITNNKDPNSQIGPDDAKKFQKIVFIGTGIGFITSILFHSFVKEKTLNNIDGFLNRSTRTISILLKDIQLYQVACVYMPTRLFVNLSQIYIPLYLHESLHMPATSLAIVPLIMFISSFVISLITAKLNKKVGKKISYCCGVMLGICACIWMHFGTGITYIKYEIYFVSVILGSAGSIMLLTSLVVTTDFIGEHTDTGAFVCGIMSFTDKLFNGLAVMLIQYLQSWVSYKHYYREILVYICSICAIFGMLIILYIKPFSHSTVYNTPASEQTVEHSNRFLSTTLENEPRNVLGQEHVT